MDMHKAKFFEIRQDVIIFNDNTKHNIHLRKGDILRLAGIKLSSMTKRSPFHYKDDIIRVSNFLVHECKSDYIDPLSISDEQVKRMYGVNDFSGVVIYPESINEEEIRQKFRDKYGDKTTLYTEIILMMFTVGIWALFFLWLWTLNH
jgi:hypothetical protein